MTKLDAGADSASNPARAWARRLLLAALLIGGPAFLPTSALERFVELVEPPGMREPIAADADATVQAAVSAQEGALQQYNVLSTARVRGFLTAIGGALALAAGGAFLAAFMFNSGNADWLFPLTVATCVVVLMAGARAAHDAELGFTPPPGATGQCSSGFVFNDMDNPVYVSFAAQAAAGEGRFANLFTTEPHEAIYFNPFFIAVGVASKLTGVEPTVVLNLVGFVGAWVSIIAAYGAAIAAGTSRAAARWTSALVALGSGLTAPMLLGHVVFGWPLWLGSDAIIQDNIPVSVFSGFPFHSCAFAMLLFCVWLALLADASAGRRRVVLLATLGVMAVALAFSHPYGCVMLALTHGAFTVISLSWAEGREAWRRRVATSIVLVAAVAPATCYNLWVASRPIWDQWAAIAVDVPRPRWVWVIGFGMMLPLSAIGAVQILRAPNLERARWFVVWAALVYGALIIVNIRNGKVGTGAHLAIAVLSAQALASWWACPRIASAPVRWLDGAARGAVLAAIFTTGPGLWLYCYRDLAYPAPLADVVRVFRDANEPAARVLTDVKSGRVLASAGAARVFAGNWHLTPNYDEKRAELLRAGFVPPDELAAHAGDADRESFDRLLRDSRTRFVLVESQMPAARVAATHPALRPFAEVATWRLYQIVPLGNEPDAPR